ncbi:MAG: nucleotidyltransferase family protein [Candidatus Bipolaricaulota bacterium]
MNEREAVLAKLAGHRTDLTRLGVRSLALFGSTVRGEARVGSDVDLLVDFARPVGLFGFLEVKSYLEQLLGRRVDLVTARALRPEGRDAVLREAVDAWAPTHTPALQPHLGIAAAS